MKGNKLLSAVYKHNLPARRRARQCHATQSNTPIVSRGTESPTQVNFRNIISDLEHWCKWYYGSFYIYCLPKLVKSWNISKSLQKNNPEQVRIAYFACDVCLSQCPYYLDNYFTHTHKKRKIGKTISSISGDTLNIIL